MTQRRIIVIVMLVLAAVAAGPGWSLSAPLPATSEEASFRLAGAAAASDDDGVTVASRRSPLAPGQMAGPMERPRSLATADEPASDHPGAGARTPRVAVQRR